MEKHSRTHISEGLDWLVLSVDAHSIRLYTVLIGAAYDTASARYWQISFRGGS